MSPAARLRGLSPAASLTGCVVLDKRLDLSVSVSSVLKWGDSRIVGRIKRMWKVLRTVSVSATSIIASVVIVSCSTLLLLVFIMSKLQPFNFL